MQQRTEEWMENQLLTNVRTGNTSHSESDPQNIQNQVSARRLSSSTAIVMNSNVKTTLWPCLPLGFTVVQLIIYLPAVFVYLQRAIYNPAWPATGYLHAVDLSTFWLLSRTCRVIKW